MDCIYIAHFECDDHLKHFYNTYIDVNYNY